MHSSLESLRLQLPASLEPFRSRIEAAVTPCIHFGREPCQPTAVDCRLGGLPLLPAGAEWPHRGGRPLAFIGQLDLAELEACSPGLHPFMARGGLLALFYDLEEQPWGCSPTHR